MAQNLLFKITINATAGSWAAGDVLDIYLDDSDNSINYKKNGVTYIGSADILSSNLIKVSGGCTSDLYFIYSCYTQCDGVDLLKWKFQKPNIVLPSEHPYVSEVTYEDSASCCSINAADFNIATTNQTNITPNGTLTITNGTENINLFEASLDDGAWTPETSTGEIKFEGIASGTHKLVVRRIGTACTFTLYDIEILDVIGLPSFPLEIITSPDTFSPVFNEIEYRWKFRNNSATVLEGEGGYSKINLSIFDSDISYLQSLQYFRIVDSTIYNGVWKITKVQSVGGIPPTKDIFFDAPFVGSGTIKIVPADKVLFDIFCEVGTALSNFQKMARVGALPDELGNYDIRVEGFLQSAFELNQPINNGIEITLSRKFYMQPSIAEVYLGNNGGIKTALYTGIEDVSPYIGGDNLIPLGPAPISFINEQTGKGFPVLFSVINEDSNRVVNITSTSEEDIISTSLAVVIAAIPLNTYTVKWIRDVPIVDLQTDPALPAWITVEAGPNNEVNLTINTFTEVDGDYEDDDYDDDDYLTRSFNALVGCYEFQFKDGEDLLFTLQICIYPVSQVSYVCPDNSLNIAWINNQGGWSSFVFSKGKKTDGIDIGSVSEFKKNTELKRSAVEEVYKTKQVNYVTLNPRELEFIASMRYAVQAYLFDENTMQWSIPIVIEKSSFPILSRPFRQIEVIGSFSFKLANEIKVQRQ